FRSWGAGMKSLDIAEFRGNFLVAFIAAALIIFLIKITPLLLPAKFYFSFAKLVGYNSEPFIVDPPGVTGEKLCALFKKYDIQDEGFGHVDCNLNYEEKGRSAHAGEFTLQDKDKVYTLALQSDPQIRADLAAAIQANAATLPSETDVKAIVGEAHSPG